MIRAISLLSQVVDSVESSVSVTLTLNAETSEMLKALWKIKLEFGSLVISVFHLFVISLRMSLFELNTCKPAVKYQKIETFTFFMICTNFTLTFLSRASL